MAPRRLGDLSAAGATDFPGSGVAGYQYRTSADGGTTWSAHSRAPRPRSPRRARRSSSSARWTSAGFTPRGCPACPTPADRSHRPHAAHRPHRHGGSTAWQNVASVTVGAAGWTDAGGSGFAGYEYRLSTDGGATWGSAQPGSSYTESGQGETLVQFHSSTARATSRSGHRLQGPPAAPSGSTAGRPATRSSPAARRPGRTAPPCRDRVRRHGLAGQRHRLLPVAHVDRRRHHVVGGADRQPGDRDRGATPSSRCAPSTAPGSRPAGRRQSPTPTARSRSTAPRRPHRRCRAARAPGRTSPA